MTLGVLSDTDGVALGLLCQDIAELEQLVDDLRKTGYLLKTPDGMIRMNPLAKLVAELNRRVMTGLREFGLTPSSRTRVEVVGGQTKATPTESRMAEFLRRRKAASA